MSDLEKAWPFPSASSATVTVPGKGTLVTLSASEELIKSYLEKFGCVPVFDGNPRRRRLARPDGDGGWALHDPDGSTALEGPARIIRSRKAQLRCLLERSWYHIGYSVQSELTEFAFTKHGEGYSRHISRGFHTVVPAIYDAFWRFELDEDLLTVIWEGEGRSRIQFVLKSQLKVAASLKDAALSFFDMTLEVEAPLFPPSAEFAKHFLKEYWGKVAAQEETGR